LLGQDRRLVGTEIRRVGARRRSEERRPAPASDAAACTTCPPQPVTTAPRRVPAVRPWRHAPCHPERV